MCAWTRPAVPLLRRPRRPHDAIGKLIVATCDDQRGRLAALADAAIDNGVNDIRAIDADEIGELEPEITAVAGLLSPSTGIVDAAALMRALLADATGAGSEVAWPTAAASPARGAEAAPWRSMSTARDRWPATG